jgi:iron(III) transport system ATP-binding protein
MSAISIRDVRKTYGGSAQPAVAALSLEIPRSDFLCLLGPSGCGKTTTLRMIAGLEHPTAGRILVDDQPVVSVDDGVYVPAEKRGMGLVFQNYALWPHMTVEENVAFGLKLRKVPKPERDATIARVLDTLAIARYRTRLPSQLSGGQQQRVALARMLALAPDIVLLDEPLSNLDAKLRLEMRAELKRIHRDMGATIVFVTHDQWEAMTLATTIAVMSEGELQQLGTPDDIYERPTNRFVAEFVGNLPINIVEMTAGPAGPLAAWIGSRLAGLPSAGAVGSVGIRPEAVRLEPAGHPDGCPARVVDVVPTGGSRIVELTTGPEKLFAIVADAPCAGPGTEVAVTVDPARLHVFDPAGRRMPV